MEGSGIGGGTGAAVAGDGDALGQNGQGDNGHGFDPATFNERLAQLSSGQDELRQFLTAQPFQAQAGDDFAWPEGDGLDAAGLEQAGWDPGEEFGEGLGDELTGDPVTDAQVLGEHFDAAMHGVVEQALAPVHQRMDDMQRVQDINDLVAEFPEIGEPETMRTVLGNARTLVEAAGWPLALAAHPLMVRLTYMAGRAYDAAHAEGTESAPNAAHLEGGGGAGPGSGGQPSLVEQILSHGANEPLGSRVLPGAHGG